MVDQYDRDLVRPLELSQEGQQAADLGGAVLIAAVQADQRVPDLFIGVCDGCAFGGNDHCVNRLTTWGRRAGVVERIALPRWWIADHFTSANIPDPIPAGSVVTSSELGFPYQLRKRALLSTEWSRYGGWSALGGATLFEVEAARLA